METLCFSREINWLRADELSFAFQRTQFPVKLCFAMTIDKSQYQSLNKVGLQVTEDFQCFAPEQLCVASSRVTGGATSLSVFKKRSVMNVVCKSVLRICTLDN